MRLFKGKIMYLLISLLLAIALFVYVNGNNLTSSTIKPVNDTQSTKTTVINVPLVIANNNSHYLISNYPRYVRVSLTGSPSLIAITLHTSTIKAYADLTDLKPGQHNVNLQVEGVKEGISSKIKPATVKFKIEKYINKKFSISPQTNTENFNNNTNLKLEPTKVQISGGEKAVNKVKKVQLKLKDSAQSTAEPENLHGKFALEGVDEFDNPVSNVKISPDKVQVNN